MFKMTYHHMPAKADSTYFSRFSVYTKYRLAHTGNDKAYVKFGRGTTQGVVLFYEIL